MLRLDTEIYLIKGKIEKAKLNIFSQKKAFAQKKDAGLNAVFSGAASSLKPKYVFTTYKMNYADENIVSYKGKYYSIWRVYESDNLIELHVELKNAYENIEVTKDEVNAT